MEWDEWVWIKGSGIKVVPEIRGPYDPEKWADTGRIEGVARD